MHIIVVDIQGFVIRGEFFPKEIAISNGHQISHYIVKPPMRFSSLSAGDKKTVIYLEREHHGIKFSDGFVNQEEVDSILKNFLKNVDVRESASEVQFSNQKTE